MAEPPCSAIEVCVVEDEACVLLECEDDDADGDGQARVSCGGMDCDDDDALRFAGNGEICDTADRDEDCDPSTFGYRDNDGDGYADAACCNADVAGVLVCGDDCDDAAAAVNPGESDVCDDRDNDCDGSIDEDGAILYLDCDGDGFGNSAVFRMGCPLPVTASPDCPAPLPSSTWTSTPGDCDRRVLPGPDPDRVHGLPDRERDGRHAAHAPRRVRDDGRRLLRLSRGDQSVLRVDRERGRARVAQRRGPLGGGVPERRAGRRDGRVVGGAASAAAELRGFPADNFYCPNAAHRFCTARGFVAGYGPVEQSAADVTVLFIRDL